jgi:fumarate reductase subunit D
MKHHSRWVLPLLLLTICLMTPFGAWGHTDFIAPQSHPNDWPLAPSLLEAGLPSPLPFAHFLPSSSLPSALLLATLACTVLLWRRSRITALGVVLVLVSFTFVLAIHAVHHIGQPDQAAECLVFAASQHVTGTLAEQFDLGAPSANHTGALCFPDDTVFVTLFYRPAQQRAPPGMLA